VKVGELFAGIGGIGLGLERAGHKVIWASETDEYARKVYAKRFPHVRLYGDIRELRDLPAVDLVAGGFPCQDISIAGKGAGIKGERSGLFFELMRVVRMVRPRCVLLENVPMLLHRGMSEVLGALAESGYDAEWDCLPAAAFGAPHRRDRIFIVAYSNKGLRSRKAGKIFSRRNTFNFSGEELADAERERELQQKRGEQDQRRRVSNGSKKENMADAKRKRLHKRYKPEEGQTSRCSQFQCKNWKTESGIRRVAHGIPDRVHRLKCLGNSVVPQVAEWIGRRLAQEGEER
jgi:DNA (cytosine-5)-methyltransferase 1